MEDTKIFVSYSWMNDSPDNEVLELVAKLRKEGYSAECDVIKMQEHTAISFVEMMSKSLRAAQKVIIVLTHGYKEKADTFKGGVGEEYRYIINDISQNVNKYILTTFMEDISAVLPDFLTGREVTKLSSMYGWDKLLHKINSTAEYVFPDVSQHRNLPHSTYISGDLVNQTTNTNRPDICQHDLILCFNDLIKKYNIIDFMKNDQTVRFLATSISDIEMFLLDIDQLLKDNITMQNDEIYAAINDFKNIFLVFFNSLGVKVYPKDSNAMFLTFHDPYNKIDWDVIRSDINNYKRSLDELYGKVNKDCTMFV